MGPPVTQLGIAPAVMIVCTSTSTHTCIGVCAQAHAHTHAHTQTRMRRCARARTRTCTCARTHTCTHAPHPSRPPLRLSPTGHALHATQLEEKTSSALLGAQPGCLVAAAHHLPRHPCTRHQCTEQMEHACHLCHPLARQQLLRQTLVRVFCVLVCVHVYMQALVFLCTLRLCVCVQACKRWALDL